MTLAPMMLGACGDTSHQNVPNQIAGGEPERGKSLIHAYGCGACHTIAGIRGARGKVGPALEDYAQQHLLAGFLPNSPRYLIAWLMDPVALSPRTAMPSHGLSEAEARHIASYLYTLGARRSDENATKPPLPLEEHGVTIELGAAGQAGTASRTRRIVPAANGTRSPPGSL
ncbi:c-type cytochrome [Microvirga brassicacearum]|uniref:C-type cytochrome n=1 Tax=Microvirga brassicacearum TaxID=2580413 RepID=A0A5N3PCK2_9HYPH|nr:c-type cytochrome [Microvirga brassicacearum]KAB0267430.1 c-type cytochrome [Microvirga brassicacearum]